MDLYWHRIKQQPAVGAAAVILFLVAAIGATYVWRSGVESVETQLPLAVEAERIDPRVVAHAAGAVRNPGLYDLPAYSRVADLIEAAGGASSDANLDQLNLAAALVDGTRVYVPAQGEPMQSFEEPQSSGPLNLNTASQSQLEDLSGVGPSTATAIIDWREQFGPFTSVDDLLEVPGIGPTKLSQLVDEVIVG